MVEGGRFRGQDSPFDHHLQPRSPRGFEARALAKFLERGGVVRRTCSSTEKPCTEKRPPQNRGDREKRFRENRQIILPPSGDWQNVSEQKGGRGGGTIIIKYSPVLVRKEGKE